MSEATVKIAADVSRRRVSRWTVRVIEGPDAGREGEIIEGQTLAVGASPDNELQLSDPTVSRYHAEVRITPRGAHVRDLGSSNGVAAGGVLASDLVAPPGTRVRLGRTWLLLDSAGSSARRADTPAPLPGLVGESDAMQDVVGLVRQLAPSDIPVLIQGETGTGKEVVARALHELSPRRDKPFVVVDCGSLPANLIASELFGHERGAFTGAEARRAGAFEQAQGGTVFLDEIGDMQPELQPVLLGVLERRRFRRLGGTQDVETNVRVLAATHRDLREDVNGGRFRPDLYFRLAVGRIELPALRERPEDIPPLIDHFAEQIMGERGRIPFDAAQLASLRRHRWSGNVRELRNIVEAAIATGQVVLEPSLREATQESGHRKPYREARAEAIAAFERAYLGELIERCDGNASEAARRARMDRPYLLTLLRKHRLR
ncbi:MAG: sigma 54-interacting transcriptional regulator [Myxococcota bacterium]